MGSRHKKKRRDLSGIYGFSSCGAFSKRYGASGSGLARDEHIDFAFAATARVSGIDSDEFVERFKHARAITKIQATDRGYCMTAFHYVSEEAARDAALDVAKNNDSGAFRTTEFSGLKRADIERFTRNKSRFDPATLSFDK